MYESNVYLGVAKPHTIDLGDATLDLVWLAVDFGASSKPLPTTKKLPPTSTSSVPVMSDTELEKAFIEVAVYFFFFFLILLPPTCTLFVDFISARL